MNNSWQRVPLLTDALERFRDSSRRGRSRTASKILVNSSTDPLPNDWDEYASDPSFSIILAWTSNHFQDFSASINSRGEVLETQRYSKLSDLTAFRGFFGDPVGPIFFVGWDRWRTHVGYRYAGETDNFSARGRDAIVSGERSK